MTEEKKMSPEEEMEYCLKTGFAKVMYVLQNRKGAMPIIIKSGNQIIELEANEATALEHHITTSGDPLYENYSRILKMIFKPEE